MDRGAWWAIVHRVTKSLTKLSMLATLLRCKVEINELKKPHTRIHVRREQTAELC